MHYPEIDALRQLYTTSRIHFELKSGHLCDQTTYKEVQVTIGSKRWLLFLYDEYDDLLHPNALLHLELLLMEIEEYTDSEDFLEWTKNLGLSANCNQALQYYRDLDQTAYEIGMQLQRSEGMLSPLDFELNAGAAQELRNTQFPVTNP